MGGDLAAWFSDPTAKLTLPKCLALAAPFLFNVTAAATPMTRDEFVAAQTSAAEELRSKVLADPTANAALINLAADDQTWVNSYLGALEESGMLQPPDQAPPIRANPKVASVMATLASGILVSAVGQQMTGSTTLTGFFEQLHQWYGDVPGTMAPLIGYDHREDPNDNCECEIPVPQTPTASEFDLGLSHPTYFQSVNVFAPFTGTSTAAILSDPLFASLASSNTLTALSLQALFAQVAQTVAAATITGPSGYGDSQYVPAGTPLPYTVDFSNPSDSTTAANEVRIETTLDDNLSVRSFRLGDIKIGSVTINVPDNSANFQGDFDLRNSLGFIVRVSAGIDPNTRIASWVIQAIDPDTGEVLQDPTHGLLVPNDAQGNGAGFVSWTAQSAFAATDLSTISASARVELDNQAPYETSTVTSTLDAVAPQTALSATAVGSSDFLVQWQATDEPGGSGVKSTTVYVKDGGGNWTIWQRQTTSTQALFQGQAGHTYEFLALSIDNAGNRELAPGNNVPSDGTVVDVGGLPQVGRTTQDIGPPPPPTNATSTNELFVQAEANLPGLVGANPSLFGTVVAPFSGEAFATGIGQSFSGIGPLAIAERPDGTFIVSGGPNRGDLYTFSQTGGNALTPTVELDTPIYDLKWDGTGGLWATSGGGQLLQLDPTTLQIIGRYGESMTQALAFDPAKGVFYVSSGDGVESFDPVTHTFTHFSNVRVDDLEIAPDGQLWGTTWPQRGQVISFDNHGAAQAQVQFDAAVDSIAFGQPGTALAGLMFISSRIPSGSTDGANLYMVDLATLNTLVVARDGPSGEQLLTTPDGRLLISNGSEVDVLQPLAAPSVLRTDPVDGSIVPLPIASVTITFDRDMSQGAASSPGSVVNPDNYELMDSSGNHVAFTGVSYDAATRTATLTFDSPPGDHYTLTVDQRIRSAAGLELAAPYTAGFDAVQDFSALVDVAFDATRSDRGSGTVSFDVQVTNRTAYDLRVPLLLVLDPTRYFQGTALGATTSGELWQLDIGSGLPNGVLAAGASTEVQTVTLTNPDAQHLNLGSGVYAMPYPNASPVFTVDPLTTATAGAAYGYDAAAHDPDGAVLTWVLLSGPAGATIDSTTGELQWLPTSASKAEQPVTLRVYDTRGGYATQSFTIDVAGGNQAPTLDVPASEHLREGQSFSFTVAGSDPEGQVLSFVADNLPPGSHFDGSTGVFDWTPSYTDAGDYPAVSFTVSDGTNVVTKLVDFLVDQVDAPPVLHGIPDRTVRQGDPVLITVQADDADGQPLTYSMVDGPPGATIDPNTGLFSWTPAYDSAASYAVQFQVSDGQLTDERTVTFTVINVNAPPIFDPFSNVTTLENQAVDLQVFAFDPDNPHFQRQVRLPDGTLSAADGPPATVTYAVSGLPDGATFDTSTGIFTWTPTYTQAGNYAVHFTATDDGNGTGQPLSTAMTVPIEVLNANRAPVLPAIVDQSVEKGDTLDIPVNATDADGDPIAVTVAITEKGLPVPVDGSLFTYEPSGNGTGLLHVAPGDRQRGDYTVTITAADNGDGGGPHAVLQASQTFVVKVESASEPPLLTPPGAKVAVIGQQLQFTLHASDLDQDPLQYSAQGLPGTATLVAGAAYGTAVFTWTPTTADAGTHTVTFTVTDSTGGSDSATTNIVARATNAAPLLLPVGNQTVAEGALLDVALGAVDADNDPLTWSATGLPAGARLDQATGHLTWQPGYDAAGTYSGIGLTVTDGAATSTETIGITVTQTDRPPEFSAIPPLGGQEERLLQFTLVATDPDGDAVIYAPAAPLPQGSAFDGSNGRFTWTPTYDQSGDYTLSFTARDAAGLFDTLQVQVDIADVNRPPSLSFTSHRVVLGDTLQFTIGGSDPDSGDTLTFSASGLPDGAMLDSATGAFSWTPGPGQIGTYPITVSVTDGKSVVSRGLELAVDPQPVGPSTTIVVTPSFAAIPGQSVTITVLASALSAIASRSLTLNGAPLSLDANGRAVITAPATGVYQLVATAMDIDGFTSTTTSELRVRDASDNTPPTVTFDAALGGQQVTAPIAVNGSVADSNLESWTLEIARTGDTHFQTLATGTGPITGQLFTLDPSRFDPSFYELRLTATDVAGRSAQATTELELASTAAAGSDFVHTVTDFTAGFGGDTLDFTRTYDSAVAYDTGSFGAGWSLDWRDLGVATNVAPTGSESLGVYNPLQAGSRVIVDTPDGGHAAFTFEPQQITGDGFTYFLPSWVADPGESWQLASASLPLQRAAGKFYALDDGSAYNPASLAGSPAQYTLTNSAGTQYAFDVNGGVTSITFADGVTLLVGDSGVVGPGNETIGFTDDRSGRLTQVTAPDDGTFDYTYDASGNLVGARNLEAGTSERYAYADPAQHLLTLVAGPAGGVSIAYGSTVTTRPVNEDLGAALAYLDQPVDGVLADGGADLYTLAVRPSEVALPQAGAFLLAVDVRAAGGSTLAPGLPDIEGLHPIVARTSAGDAYAVFRITSAALLTLHVTGAGAGAYVLDLRAAGDVNGDQVVDGLDMAALAAALGTSAGDTGYVAAADVNGDGRIDSTDSHLVVANLGFSADQAPQIGTGSGFTHVDLETSVDVSTFVTDAENDPLAFRIVSASNGTARLSGDGSHVLFTPDPDFSGTASFVFVADDGFSHTAPTAVGVTVSNAPLVRLDFAQRNPKVPLGNVLRPTVIGDFADQVGVALPSSYITLSSTNPTAVRVVANESLVGAQEGFAALVATRGIITGATAVVAGSPNQFDDPQLFTGLTVYPHAVTLVPNGGLKQIQVSVAGTDVSAATSGILYFAGNSDVVSVGANGLITGLAEGQAQVTVVYLGAEYVIGVRVNAPQGDEATLGADGGALEASDGAIVAIAPGSLDGTQDVSFTPVTTSSLPLPMPTDWTAVAAYDLQFGGDKLSSPAQLAIPVPDTVPVGETLFLLRYGQIPDAQGNLQPIWWQDEEAIVGADHVARTSSPPWPGVEPSGVYALSDPGGITKYGLVRGIFTMDFPIGVFPVAATLAGVMATFSPTFAVSINVSSLHYVAIPQEGLPITTDVGVHVEPGAIKDVSVTMTQPLSAIPTTPVLGAATFQFKDLTGSDGQTHPTPIVVLDGLNFDATGASISSQFTAVWHMADHEYSSTLVPGVGNGSTEIGITIPQQVVAGLAEISIVRTDTVVDYDPGTGLATQVQHYYESNRLKLGAGGDYVTTGSYGCISGCDPQPANCGTLDSQGNLIPCTNQPVISAEVDVFTQGDPFSSNPASALQLVAQIPVGKTTGISDPSIRDTALTPDRTRAYATLIGESSVAVVDMVAMQEVDAQPGNCNASCPDQVDEIKLPDGSQPFWIALDKAGKYAYVSDQAEYGGPGDWQGRIYVIDIDPNSPTFNQKIHTIDVASACQGLREIAVSEDGNQLYVAAPNRDGTAPPPSTCPGQSNLLVVNIDPGDRPMQPDQNPHHFDEQIASYTTGQETYAVQTTDDPKLVLITNRYTDADGVQELDITDNSSRSFTASVSDLGCNGQPNPPCEFDLTLGATSDTFDVNNAEGLAILPADTFKDVVGPDGQKLGSTPEYIFVAGYNRFIQDDPSHDPDAVTESLSGAATPGGSNIGIVQVDSSGATLIAATTPIPLGSIDNLAFASGFNYLFASYRGVEIGNDGMGAVFVYNLVNLIWELKNDQAHDSSGLSKFPLERLAYDPTQHQTVLLPLQENLQGINAGIDIKADYRIIRYNGNAAQTIFGVPYLQDLQGDYERIDPATGAVTILNYQRDQYGNFIDPSTGALIPPNLWPTESPNAPFAIGGLARGLSADLTKTGPGPLIWNAAMAGMAWGTANRYDFGVKDALAQICGPQNCASNPLNSNVDLFTGGVTESVDLPPYTSLGQTQQLHLVYNSLAADASPIVTFGWQDIGAEMSEYLANSPSPDELSAGGNPLLDAQITFSGAGGTLTGQKVYWQVDPTANDVTVSVQTDLSSLKSGQYGYTIVAHFLGKERVSTGTLLLDNEIDSVFGTGWRMPGVQSLDIPTDQPDSVDVVDAGGQMETYDLVSDPASIGCAPTPGSQGTYISALDGRTTIEKLADGTWQRTLPDGTMEIYDPSQSAPTDPDLPNLVMPIPVTKVTDRYGNVTEYHYDGAGHLVEIDDPVGLKTTFEYSGDHVTTITDPGGRKTLLTYDGKDLQTITTPDGATRIFGYDKGHLTSQVNTLGGTEIDYYDDQGRAYEADRPADDGSKILLSAWQDQGLPHTDDADPKADPAVALDKKLDELTATYTYANGNMKTVTMNERGQVLEEDDAYGLIDKYTRDENGFILTETDANGNVTTNTYDDRGNRITISDSLSQGNASTTMSYDGTYNVVTSITDELGHETKYILDDKGDVQYKIDQDGNQWEYTYYPQGMLETVTDPLHRTTTYFYDGVGRVKEIDNPDGTFRLYSYDGVTGDTTSVTDEDGNTTKYVTYDGMGRLETELEPLVQVNGAAMQPELNFTYYPNGAEKTATDANGNTTSYTYDTSGRMLTQTDAYGGTTTYHYDDKEQLEWVQDPLGNRTTFAYDQRYRQVVTADASSEVTTVQWSSDGQVLTLGGALGIDTFVYDATGRFVASSGTLPGITRTDYDAGGNVIAVTDPLGRTTYYGYDKRNRIVVTADASSQATSASWSADGSAFIVSSPLGQDVFVYQGGTVVRNSGTVPGVTNVEYDAAGNRTAVVDALGNRTAYAYDDLNRLESTTDPAVTTLGGGKVTLPPTTYTYDAVGNLLSVTDPLGHTTWYG